MDLVINNENIKNTLRYKFGSGKKTIKLKEVLNLYPNVPLPFLLKDNAEKKKKKWGN